MSFNYLALIAEDPEGSRLAGSGARESVPLGGVPFLKPFREHVKQSDTRLS